MTQQPKQTSKDPQDLLRYITQRGPAPVHLWNPPFCGDMDMRIAANGTWYHQGAPIGRIAMVRLFSSILKREGDEYFLVTPVEKLRIRVDDCPFLVTDLQVIGKDADQQLQFTTSTGETVTADHEHPLKVETASGGEPHPLIHVRSNLWALIHRNVFYRLVDMAEHRTLQDRVVTGVRSSGEFFVLGNYANAE